MHLLLTTVCQLTIALIAATTFCYGQDGRITTIRGYSSTGTDTVVITKLFEDARYAGVRTPVNVDSTFEVQMMSNEINLYELALLSQIKTGAWRPLRFFNDGDTVAVSLRQEAGNQKSTVSGSKYLDTLNQFTQATEETWFPIFNAAMEKASQLPQEKAMLVRDSLFRALNKWQLDRSKAYPAEIQAVMFYDNLVAYQENDEIVRDLNEHYPTLLDRGLSLSFKGAIDNKLRTVDKKLIGSSYQDFYLIEPGKSQGMLLSDRLKGSKYVLLDMWSPWCSPCIGKSVAIRENYGIYTAKGITVVGIVGGINTEDGFRQAINQHKYPWTNFAEISNQQSLWAKYGFDNSGGGQVLINTDGIIVALNPTLDDILELDE